MTDSKGRWDQDGVEPAKTGVSLSIAPFSFSHS
jgi:hypothetical protein